MAIANPPGGAGKKRILVVDDEVSATRALASLLTPEFEVETANDGFLGFEMALKNPGPDLIVADVDMPGMNGTTMVARIREKRKIPVIFVTARNGPLDVVKGIQVGARHYIAKPVDIDELEKKIRRALGMGTSLLPGSS